ncbi:hypothetical protein ACFOOP_05620 [Marinicaulis aureus]|uniref:Uncharacterized protein n=1 Tax=Hyphococcus aureus TaxID=2666033 RepID=A0ABW1KXM0_9PROT
MFGLKFGGARKQDTAPDGEFIIARLNAKVQPIDRGDYYEDPLTETLAARHLGEVTGGGTQLSDEPCGIEFCDLEICVHESGEETVAAIIERLEALGAPKGSRLIIEATDRQIPFGVTEGIAVYLNGTELADEVYRDCDVNHVIDEFDRLLKGKGAFRGHWQGDRETALFCYGASFAEMKAALEPFLSEYPLCERARVEQIA